MLIPLLPFTGPQPIRHAVDLDVKKRIAILLLVLLTGGVVAISGAGPRLVTALSIAAIAAASLAFVGIHVARSVNSSSNPSDISRKTHNDILPD